MYDVISFYNHCFFASLPYEGVYLFQVRVSSPELQQRLMTDLKAFCDTMRLKEMNSFNEPVSGEVSLQLLT